MAKTKLERFLKITPKNKNIKSVSVYEKGDFWLTTIATVLVILGLVTVITAPNFMAFADNYNNPNGGSTTGVAQGNGTSGMGNGSGGTAQYNGTSGNPNYLDTPANTTQNKIEQKKRENRGSDNKTDQTKPKKSKGKKTDKSDKSDKSDSKENRADIMKAYNLASKKQQKAVQSDMKGKISKFGKDGSKASDSDWKDFVATMKKDVGAKKKGSKAQTALYKATNSKSDSDSDSDGDKDDDDDGSGKHTKSQAVDGVIKAMKNGDYAMQKPHTLAGKIGQAIFNFFWSTSAGKWLQQNSLGGTIFGGAITNGQLKSLVKDNPILLMYPRNTAQDKMFIVSNWLEPAMMGVSLVFMVLALIMAGTKMSWKNISDPSRSRLVFFHSMLDTGMSLIALWCYPAIINTLLQFDGAILIGFNSFMNQITVNDKTNVLDVALKLGVDDTTLNMLSSGGVFGSDFSGALFGLIYLFTYLGLAIWIKYYYFIRSIVFTVLVSVGPIFIAFWTTDWGKSRTINWFKEIVSTIYIQCVNALTLTFMSLFMAWNNTRMLQASAELIVAQNKWGSDHKIANFFSSMNIPLVSGAVDKAFGRPEVVKGGFEVMVVGFIIMITFQPLSRSLAELFGLQTNMLDNLHQSTSRTLQTGALIGGAALGVAALGASNLLLAKGGINGIANLANGVKKAKGVEGGFKAKRGAMLKGIKENMAKHKKNKTADGRPDPKDLRSFANKMWGVMGAGAGQLATAGMGIGSEADFATLSAMTKAGGKIGERAASGVKTPLKRLGLMAQDKLSKKYPEAVKKLFGDKNEATEKEMVEEMAKDRVQAIDKANADPGKKMQEFENNHNMANAEDTAGLSDSAMHEYRDLKKRVEEAKKWNGLSDEDKQKVAMEDINNAIHGGDAQATGFATGSEVKAQLKEVMSSFDGTSYDAEHGLSDADIKESPSNLTSKAITDKAKSMGLSKELDKFRSQNPQDKMQSDQDYLVAQRDHLNELGNQASQMLKDSALDTLGNTVASAQERSRYYDAKEGDQSFNGSMISKMKLGQNIADGMKKLNIDSGKLDEARKAVANMSGQAMISADEEVGGAPTTVLDQKLYNKFIAGQKAYANNFNQDTPKLTDDDMKAVMSHPEDFSSARIDKLKKLADGYLKDSHRMRYEANKANSDYWIHQGADIVNPYSVASWISGISPSSFGGGSSVGGGGNPFLPRYNQRVMAYNQNKSESLGMSLSDANAMLNRVVDKKTGRATIPQGDFRIVTTNGFSRMEAKDANGTYQIVGNLGLGDSTLAQGQEVYTNLDMDGNNMPILARDPVTHQTAPSYIIGEDNVSHVPYTFSNGFMPDPTTMISTKPQSVMTPEAPRSMFHSKMFTEAPEFHRAFVNRDYAPTMQEYQSKGYSNFKFVLDNNQCVITGEDANGKTQVLSAPGKLNQTIFSNLSIPSDTVASIDLTFDGNGYVPTYTQRPNEGISILSNNNNKNGTRSLIDQLGSMLRSDYYGKRGLNDYIGRVLLYPTRKSMTNEISNNPAGLGVTEVDTYRKNKHW